MTGRAQRAARLAFVWHCAEAALVITLAIYDRNQSVLIGALLLLALVGWAWSLAHLPGRSA